MPRTANLIFVGVVGVAVTMTALIVSRTFSPTETKAGDGSESADKVDVQVASDLKSDHQLSAAQVRFPVTVRRPAGPPRIALAGSDPQGRSGSVACSTCHAVRQPNLENVSAETLDEFHQGMTFSHGKIACYACHNVDDADALRLADGTKVAYQDVMSLCSQCHGRQAVAFEHGAHGGMNGHWDLTRGPQMKNNCIDCHDPHDPSYPNMIVGFKPKDRFNAPPDHDHKTDGAEPQDAH